MNLQCPYCSGSLEADASAVGGKAQCPFCKNKFLVTGPGESLKMDELAVVCPGCSARLVLGARSVGVKSVCPFCGQHFVMSAPESVSLPPAERQDPPAETAAALAPEPDVPQTVLTPGEEASPTSGPGSTARNNIVNACILGGMILVIIICAFLCGLWLRR